MSMSKTLEKKITKGGNFTLKQAPSIADSDGKQYKVAYKKSGDLTAAEKDQIYTIFDVTMRDFYLAQSSPWKDMVADDTKRKEIFDEKSRFHLIYSDESEVIAFADVRYEANDLDRPEHPIVYLYEFHVKPEFQGKHLGANLLAAVKALGQRLEMKQIMLTCFKINTKASTFYTRQGFEIDGDSPSKCGDAKACYEIWSLRI